MYLRFRQGKQIKSCQRVAQLVEHDKTGLGKGLNSKTDHLLSALSRVRLPSRWRLLNRSGAVRRPYRGKTSLDKGFHSRKSIGNCRFESCPGKAVCEKGGCTMGFMEQLHTTLSERKRTTENGAFCYETTGKALVDLNFSVASLRSEEDRTIIQRFLPAFYEDRILAVKWLFFLRDIRGGLGERRTFCILIQYLAKAFPEMTSGLIEIIAEYGRFDDLLYLLDTPLEQETLEFLRKQLEADILSSCKGGAVSLCAKWMPGKNTSSQESRKRAAKLQRYMGLTAREYRKMLSTLRACSGVTETYMSNNCWEQIDYRRVSSRANLLYRRAFLIHDKERREKYLKDVQENGAVIHAGVLMPHEIVTQYMKGVGWNQTLQEMDTALEELWNHLPDTVKDASNVLCVVDGSGSMTCPVGNGGTMALYVSNALGIYFAERMSGAYHNKFVTFSARPEYVDLSSCRTLREKLELALSHCDCTNTNIEATFELILQTAVRNHLSQKELPNTILIISDMEFDRAVYGQNDRTLFDTIKKRFKRYGYRMPKLVFWNVNSRTNGIPVRENELGVGLVSGFSVNICNMVLTNELDPFECLKKELNSERYKKVEELVSV